ncbi:thioesterase family protein [Hymenobacter rubidus]|uniref:thioesterase family protein n=1 Tax=Hymenobacter rubidus TaxID=1441626 RepID=UPI00191F38D7|nr:thioesterase family protein [Hymenobacter rubidus]
MNRVKVALPDTFSFSTEAPVAAINLNYGGHLGYDALLALLHQARTQFLQANHFPAEFDADTKLGLIMVDVAVEYKSEAFEGDVLQIDVAAADPNKYGFDVVYHVHKSGKEVARAKTGMLCFDYNIHKLRLLPEELAARF